MLGGPEKQEFFKLSFPSRFVSTCVSAAPAASPSPSEGAIYGGPSPSASGIFVADEDSREARFSESRAIPLNPPLYRF